MTRRFLENFTFASLIAPATNNEFRDQFWEQKPLAVHRGQPDYYRDLHVLRDFDAAISSYPKYVKTTDARTKGTIYHQTTVTGFEAMIADMREGGTLVLDQAQCVDSTLWRLCRLLEAELGHRFQANLYLTPPHGKGSIPHWDDHDVFVLQVLGRKKWQIETQRRALPARGEKMDRVEGREFYGDVTELMLEQGDLLYLPRGWIHAAECGPEPSLHVTIGLIPHFFEDLLRAAIRVAIEGDASLGSPLPPGFMRGQFDEVIDHASVAFRSMADSQFLAQVFDRYRVELAKSGSVTCGAGIEETLQALPSLNPRVPRPAKPSTARPNESEAWRRARSLPEVSRLLGRIFDSEECASSVRSYRARPEDIIISPIGESGTTLLQQMFHTLRTRGDMDFDDISRVVPWIEMARALDIDLDALQKAEPRGFKSHMLYEEIPKGARYIVSLRDPKDTIVSRFRHHEGWLFEAGAVPLSSYVRSAIRARKGPEMWTHLIGWWEQRENPNVLLLSYEHMVADAKSNVRAVAGFCGIELDEDLLELTLTRCSLDFMLQHRSRFDDAMLRKLAEERCGIPQDSDASKVRKGGVGSHRTQLSPDLISVMEAAWSDVVTPVLGFKDYASFESALRARV